MKSAKMNSAKNHRNVVLLVGLLTVLFSIVSCSGKVDTTIRNDSSARVAIRIDVPETLAARVRQLSDVSPKANLFDIARIKQEFSTRKSIQLIDASSGGPNSMTAVLWVPDLGALVKDTSLVPTGMITFEKVAAYGSNLSQHKLAVNITKDNASAAYQLFPGMDQSLIENLNPPALDKDPVSAQDYRTNLETVIIGKKAMPAFDACTLDVTVTLPKTATSGKGGTINGQTFKAKLPLFDILMLEKPIQMELVWPE